MNRKNPFTDRLSRPTGLALLTALVAATAGMSSVVEPPVVQPPAVQSAAAVVPAANAAPRPAAEPATPEVHSGEPQAAPAELPVQTPLSAGDRPPADEPRVNSWSAGLGDPEQWTSPEGLSSTLQTLLVLAVVSLAPAVLMMTTCFVRISVVLGLLRQGLGTQQLPSNQIVSALALFMTLLVMTPVWTQVYREAVEPYTSHEITLEEAWDAGVKPVRGFMSAQIERTGNSSDVWLFYKYLPKDTPQPSNYDDVPLTVLLPAFMLSELKTAFLIGFQIFLPFLVIDLVVASVSISMGMFMLPPVLVSLPLKLLLFVLVDGWHLVVGMLLDSFQMVA
jgi:flagellar biosynthetic protein FliP